jgi:MerR family copper efflux transcriptional regulator
VKKIRDPAQTLSIGEVARMAGVNVQTVRYYERRNLVPAPPRRQSGYRAYPLDTVPLIRFIRRARELGFSLRDVAELVRLRKLRKSERKEVESIVSEKLRAIDEKIGRLNALRAALNELEDGCRGPGRIYPEGVIESLSDSAR